MSDAPAADADATVAPGPDGAGDDPDAARSDGSAPDGDDPGRGAADPGSRRALLIGVACWGLVVFPLAIAVAAIRRPQWYPIADLAQYELRVRDVGSSNTPLIGLAGRIGPWYDPGSHPGPLSFWALAPVYRLLGSTAFAFVVSALFLHASAVALSLWMGFRRGGLWLLVALTGGFAVLTRFYGADVFLEPWNPYLPVLWWFALLMAVWSVLDGDAPMILVAVFAGSFCAQTHLPYVGLVGGMAAFLAVPLVLAVVRLRRAGDRAEFVRRRNWTLGGLVLAVVLWAAPVYDEIWGVGNLTRIKDSLSNPTDAPSGLATGLRQVLFYIDPTRLTTSGSFARVAPAGAISWGAVVLLLVWAASAVGVWRLRHQVLVRLHLVLAVGLVLALVSCSRVYGLLWAYLFMWAWSLSILMMVATAWSLVVLVRPHLSPSVRPRLAPAALGVALAVALLAAGTATVTNRNADFSRRDLSDDLGVVARQSEVALADGVTADGRPVLGGGLDGRYLVRWVDEVTIGSQGFGLLNQLERVGFTVGVDAGFGVGGTRHRIMEAADATAIVVLTTGPTIPEWDAKPEATQIAYTDPRTEQERIDVERWTAQVEEELLAAGLTDLAADWNGNQFTTSVDPAVPPAIATTMREVLEIRAPVAVYVMPAV